MEREEVLTVEQVAQILKLHPRTVRRKIEAGVIPGYRLPGTRRLYVKKADLLAALEPVGQEDDAGDDGDERIGEPPAEDRPKRA